MITIRFEPSDLAKLRFALSPLWEVMASLRVLRDRAPRGLHGSWVRDTEPLLGDAGLDLGFLYVLAPKEGRYNPDFLFPLPDRPTPSFAEQLTQIRSTPANVVATELGRMAAGDPTRAHRLEPLAAEPEIVLERLADQLDLYWHRVLSRGWKQMESVLEGEVVYRARRLGYDGPEDVLSDLHPKARLDGLTLEVDKTIDDSISVEGQGLVLIPSIFAWPDVFVGALPPWRPFLCYPARGAGALWEEPPADREDGRLATLIGSGRARVLVALDAPITTTLLARRLGLSPAATSQHLTRLHATGMIDRVRIGKRVYYGLTRAGRDLLALFEDETSQAPSSSTPQGKVATAEKGDSPHGSRR